MTRAVAGPFDLGDVIVRARAEHRPGDDRGVTVTTDPFPTILQGIPLQLRDVRLTVDRPAFMLNPTSCAAQYIDATVTSTAGTKSSPSNPYQATDCAALALKPKLALPSRARARRPMASIRASSPHLTQQPGESRLSKVAVTLPLALALDPDNAQGLCKPEQAAAKACPVNTIVGQAKAVSVLHEPLAGPVYFVEGIRIDPKSGRKIRTLPKLFITLKGEGVEVDLNASSDVDPLDRLVTTFDGIPDAPISSVDLSIDGGRHGILTVSDADICKSTQIADQQIDGHNRQAVRHRDRHPDLDLPAEGPVQEGRQVQRGGQDRWSGRRQGHGQRQGHQEDDQDHHHLDGRDDHRQAHQGSPREGHGHLRPNRPRQGPQDQQVAQRDQRAAAPRPPPAA